MSILIFIFILLALIVVHEWGHFITAKKAGIRVDEFGIGFPPRAWTFFKKNGTDYTLNWLPFGGFVKIFGEDPQDVPEGHPDRERSLVAKPWYIQALVLVAGVGMNVIAAWLLFTVAFMAGVPASAEGTEGRVVSDPALTVLQVLKDSPAANAGLMVGDRITGISSQKNTVMELTPENVITFVEGHEGDSVLMSIDRGDLQQTIEVIPQSGIVPGAPARAALGISMGVVGTLQLPVHLALYEAGIQTLQYFWIITTSIISFFGSALTLSADLSQVAGPVGIVSLVGDAAQFGFISLITFAAVISLHLAVINLLPIPALDGGRLLFVLIEAVRGKAIQASVAQMANTIGFFVLIFLMLAVTVSDVAKLFM